MILCEVETEGERGGRAAVDEDLRPWYCHADGAWRPEAADALVSEAADEILAAIDEARTAREMSEYAVLAEVMRELRASLAGHVDPGALGPLR